MGNVTAQMMLSTRDLNTVYKGSMSKILGKEDTTYFEAIDADTIMTDMRHSSPPNKNAISIQFPQNATSQYVKRNNNTKKEAIPETYEEEVEYY